LTAYGDSRRRTTGSVLEIRPAELYSMDDALARLERLLGKVPEWRSLASFLPVELRGGIFGRSAVAATFAASLELARSGRLQLRQDATFGPIFLRSPPDGA
jgi:segregation and condensation protein A